MRKLLALTLSLLMVFSVIPAAMVSAEGETYVTVFDADTSDGSKITNSYNALNTSKPASNLVAIEKGDHTKAYYIKKSGAYDGFAVTFGSNFRDYAKDAIGIRFWLAGDENAITNSSGFSVGLKAKVDGATKYYKFDGEKKNNFAPTEEGKVYEVMFSSYTKLYNSNEKFNAIYTTVTASTIFNEQVLGNLQGIMIGRDESTVSDAAKKAGYYIDDVELIFPAGVTPSPLEYVASFEGTETAQLTEEVADIVADVANDDAVVMPEATLVEGEIEGWATAKDFTTVYAPGETAKITGNTTFYAVRADKPVAATPAAPTTSEVTGTSVTLTAVDGAVYSKDGVTWQTSAEFTGLEAGATYTFYQKMAETLEYAESTVSEGLTVTLPISYTFDWIRGTDKLNDFNETITPASNTLTTNDYNDGTCMTTSRSLVAGDILSYTTKENVVAGIYKVDFEIRAYTGRAKLNIKVGDRDYGTFVSPSGGSNTVINLFEDYAHEEEGPVTITFTAETSGTMYIEQLHLTKVGDVDLGTTRKVKIDGEEVAEVELGSEYTVPTPPTGYYYSDGNVDYYGGEVVVIEGNLELFSEVVTTTVVYTMDEGSRLPEAKSYAYIAGVDVDRNGEYVEVNGDYKLALKAQMDRCAYIKLPSDWSSKPYYKPTKITFTVSKKSSGSLAFKTLKFASEVNSSYVATGETYDIITSISYINPTTYTINVTEDMYDCSYISGQLYAASNWSETVESYVLYDDVKIDYEYDFDYVPPVECKVTIDGVEVATVMSGETYVLPALEAGKYYVGYEGVTEVEVTGDLNLTTATYTYDITVDGEVVDTVDYGTEYTLPALEAGKYYVGVENTTFVVTEDKEFTTAIYEYDITIDGVVVATLEYGEEYTLPTLPVSKYYVDVEETTFVVTSDLAFTTAYKDVVDSLIVYDADANGKTGTIAMWTNGKTGTYDGRTGMQVTKGSTYRGAGVSSVNMFGTFADYADTAIGVRFWVAANSDECANPIKVYIGSPSNLSDSYISETLAGESTTIAGTTWTQFTVMFNENVTAEEIASMTYIMFVTFDKDIAHYIDDVELLLSEEVDSAYDITVDGEVVDTAEHNSVYTLPELAAGKYYVDVTDTTFVVTEDKEFTTATYTFDITIDGVVVATVAYGDTFVLPAVAEGMQYADGFVVGQEFVVTEALSFTTEEIPEQDGLTTSLVSTQEGAAIRLNEVNGMRFYATFNGDLADVDEMGIIIAPNDIVGDYFTMEDDHLKVVYDHVNNPLWSENTFVGSIVNVADRNLARDFIARAYVVIDGVTYYAEQTTVRNLAGIADAYIADANGGYAELDADTKELVDTWAKAND